MEILSFTFGALTLVALALITIFIMATIKVYKLNKQFEQMNRDYYDMHSNTYRQIDSTSQNIYQVMAEDRREINSRLNALESLINKPKK
mgnify:CR=1 FL=1|jgi:hypothetical protein